MNGYLKNGASFGLESTLSGKSHIKILEQAKALGYLIDLLEERKPVPPNSRDHQLTGKVSAGAWGKL